MIGYIGLAIGISGFVFANKDLLIIGLSLVCFDSILNKGR